ncbi:transmembrane protein 186-like [Paramacrobiotus metropolitanus]|uniref:transmembrane protein 186-like n=1 Tax=Paramacrobiotus metropolitanus TaxID=2943436 RepID=UPI00244571EA|nr:transmembrane protein 186-like [Paramacrobiotus metropolitanus]
MRPSLIFLSLPSRLPSRLFFRRCIFTPPHEPRGGSPFGAKGRDWRLVAGGQYAGHSKMDIRAPLNTKKYGLFTPFYHFPFIVHVRALQRMKLYQTVGATLLTGGVIAAAIAGLELSPIAVPIMMMGNVMAFAFLLITTIAFQRWIGRMYINEAKDKVLISHLTFWGQRNNVVFPISDITPLGHLAPGRFYTHVPRLSDPKDYYTLCTRFGGILDGEAFNRVFGADTMTYFTEAAAALDKMQRNAEKPTIPAQPPVEVEIKEPASRIKPKIQRSQKS